MGARLMAIVAEGDRGRVYLAPAPEHEAAARRGEADVEARHGQIASQNDWRQLHAIRHDIVGRSLHPPPARGADDLLRTWCRKRGSAAKRDALAAGLR